ncbi:MAG: hypothetical protein DI613_07285 [Kocuria rhizophila]|jgi:hypothetical protein|uniref:hypothetical protein n=1 Tax=Sphingomonas hankookensis TaxID=563996 RepID=UPI000DB002FB|nr:hypothetical protein [uncultured Sphingomonas sp.]PZP33153.1 MAG: hypothetical protein DI613_07285 [Kocuria rhizophila]
MRRIAAQDEARLREAVSAVPLEWAAASGHPFTGEARSEYADIIEVAGVVVDETKAGLQRAVDSARNAGMSWSEIGLTLGISKQAAQQRFMRSQ